MDSSRTGWFESSRVRWQTASTLWTEVLCPSSINPNTLSRTASDRTIAAYLRAMPRSDFANDIAALSIRAVKNGHRWYISRRRPSPSGSVRTKPSRPWPIPYQAESRWRDCVHESTHGIARSWRMSRVCWRLAGRDPMRRCSIRSMGVASQK